MTKTTFINFELVEENEIQNNHNNIEENQIQNLHNFLKFLSTPSVTN